MDTKINHTPSNNSTLTEHIVENNTPIHLNTTSEFWIVTSGAMAVFFVTTVNGISQGARRYLFDVNAGDALFGISPTLEGQSYELIAVAYEETRLEKSDLLDQFKETDSIPNSNFEFLQLIKNWSNSLVAFFRTANIQLTDIDIQELHTPSELVENLYQFQLDIVGCLHQLQQQEEAAQSTQFNNRQKLNQQISNQSIGNLTAIFQPKIVALLQEGTALLMAAGAVGRVLGIDIRPPARSEDPKRIKDPLEAIARASRMRIRRVILNGLWWQSDCGPLLGYTVEGEKPVALLPVGSHGYEIFDPEKSQRLPFNVDTAKLISPVAFMFYSPFPEKISNTLEVLKFATRGKTKDIITLLLMGILGSLLGMLTPQATGILIDKAIPDGNRGLIFQIGLGLLSVIAGTTLFELIQSTATSRVQTLTSVSTQTAIWDRLLKLRVAFFRRYSTGDLQSRVSAITRINDIVSGTVLKTIFHGFFSLLNLGLLFYYNAKLAFIAVGVAVVNIIFTTVSGILTSKRMTHLQEIEGEIFGLTVQLIGGVSKLYVSGAEQRAFAYWSKRFSRQLQLILSTQAIEHTVSFFNTILPNISSMLIYFVVVSLVSKGGTGFSTGTFLAFNTAFGTFIGGATSLSNTLIEVLEVSVLWKRAKPILDEIPEVNDDKTDPGRLSGGVKLDRVSFRYRQDIPLTLDRVTIEAEPGEFIALVGPSGSGKSTTVRLLLGFEQPEEGTIYYDGQDLSGLDISAVRRQLGVVLQNGRINSASIFENISGGALVTMDEAWEAAKMAGFAEDVQQMPMGMHTVISEGATNISGGQRQRLLIARALVLKPKILIFDEATSALDNRTQAIVSQSLEQLNVTRIVIAHRLSTIRNANRIYVIAAGQVLQKGNFEQLMAQPGMFAELMQRQLD